MGEIIDIFTRKSTADKKMAEEAEKLVEERGFYIGCLTKELTTKVLNYIDTVNLKIWQPTTKQEELDALLIEYEIVLKEALVLLRQDPAIAWKVELFVTPKGHCWLIKREPRNNIIPFKIKEV